ncbi:hypothetical protein ACFQND_04125 [Polaromonas aquatica]|uniref:Uncharacterized protein n=1 Tax=Polaromonas aquatica TaxID=332657 RepID=A0ABW1TUA6_9BURK
MHRFIFLLFLAMTFLQPAVSGMPRFAAQSDVALSAEVKAGNSNFSQGKASHANTCFSHIEAFPAGAPAGCNAGQPCSLCNVCQVCHQAAMTESQPPAPGHISIRPSFPSVASGYFSAERAQSFKPPIL